MRYATIMLALLVTTGCTNQSAPVGSEPRNEPVEMAPAPRAVLGQCGEERNPQRWVEACTKVIESGRLDPQERAWALTIRAQGYLEEDPSDRDRALADAEAAVRTDPNNGYAYRTRGQAYALMGQDRKALADYDAAIRINPSEGYHYFVRGSEYWALRQTDAADRDFARAVELDPKLKWIVETLKNMRTLP